MLKEVCDVFVVLDYGFPAKGDIARGHCLGKAVVDTAETPIIELSISWEKTTHISLFDAIREIEDVTVLVKPLSSHTT